MKSTVELAMFRMCGEYPYNSFEGLGVRWHDRRRLANATHALEIPRNPEARSND